MNSGWPSACGSETQVCLIFNPLMTFLSHLFHFAWSLVNIWGAVSNQAAQVDGVCLVYATALQFLDECVWWHFSCAIHPINIWWKNSSVSEQGEVVVSLSPELALSVTLECNQLRALGELTSYPGSWLNHPWSVGEKVISTVPKGIPIGGVLGAVT